MNRVYLMIFLLFLFGCSEEEIIPEQNPVDLPPGDFVITLSNITDITADISWTPAIDPDSGQVVYDIALGDSVIAFDKDVGFTIKNLQPDSPYLVRVIALDAKRNESVRTAEFRTQKAWIGSVYGYDLGYYKIGFSNVIETRDGGLFIQGSGKFTEYGWSYTKLYLKFDKDYQVEWFRETNFDPDPIALLEGSDGSYYIVFTHNVIKLDNQGNEVWDFEFPASYHSYLEAITENYDGNLILAGASIIDSPGNYVKEYFVSMLSPDKNEIWSRIGGSIYADDAKAVMVEEDHTIAIYGTDGIRSILFFLGQDGEFLREYPFDNDFSGEDVGAKYMYKFLGNYLLFSSIGTYNSDYVPHYLNIGPTGSLNADTYPDVSVSEFTTFEDVDDMGNGKTLILTTSYNRTTVAILGMNGVATSVFDMYNFPSGDLIRYDHQDSNYVLVTYNGQVIIFNHDGYYRDEYWKAGYP